MAKRIFLVNFFIKSTCITTPLKLSFARDGHINDKDDRHRVWQTSQPLNQRYFKLKLLHPKRFI